MAYNHPISTRGTQTFGHKGRISQKGSDCMASTDKIVTMDSEYCSMGRWISIICCSQLDLKLYETKELAELTDEPWCTRAYVEDFDRRLVGKDPNEVAQDPEFLRLKAAMDRAIEKAAAAGPCIIHERAASSVLAGRDDVVRVLLYGSNICDKYPRAIIDPTTDLTEDSTTDEIRALICERDQMRSVYHDAVMDTPWGDKAGYDLCLDSSALGREKCAEIICEALTPVRLDKEQAAKAVSDFMESYAK